MKKKTCSKCLDKKPVNCFSKSSQRKDGRHPHCKECVSSYYEEYRKNRSPKQKEKVKETRTSLRERNHTFMVEYLQLHPCVDCGENRVVTLDFDHVRGEKHYNVSAMVNSAMSLDAIQLEIEKCEVRCANCHRIKTANQFGWKRSDE